MADVGHGAKRKRGVNYVSVALQFIVAVLLAFIGFTLQGLRTDTTTALTGVQQTQVSISRIDSKIDGITDRLERLERIQDQDQ